MSKINRTPNLCECCHTSPCLLKERAHLERGANLLEGLLTSGAVKPTRIEMAWLKADKKRRTL